MSKVKRSADWLQRTTKKEDGYKKKENEGVPKTVNRVNKSLENLPLATKSLQAFFNDDVAIPANKLKPALYKGKNLVLSIFYMLQI